MGLASMLGFGFLESLIKGKVLDRYNIFMKRQLWSRKRGVGHSEGIIAPGFYNKTQYRNYIRSKRTN